MSRANWSLRLARPEDAETMPAIELAAAAMFRSQPGLSEIDFEDVRTPDQFRRLIGKGHCLVAHVETDMVGFLVAEPFRRELHIWEMDVHPSHQGNGVGSGMVRACQIDARNAGFSALTLTTFHDVPWNGPFYRRLGFSEVTDIAAHPRLEAELAEESNLGLPADRRCAMIHFLD